VLSSNNLSNYDSWKGQAERVFRISHNFLDAAVSEFLSKATKIKGMERAAAGAMKSRAIGLGVLGWHDLLMSKNLPFDNSMEVMRLNAEIFRTMRNTMDENNARLAKDYGEPEWLRGYNMRNGFLMAVAPTKTNSAVSGSTGEGIQPIIGASWVKEGAEGDIYSKNPHFEKVLDKYGKNDYDTWKTIYRKKGSVQHLPFLTDHEKKVFLTAREIDQHKLVVQAAQRGQYIDQGQSLNLFFPKNAHASYINSVHLKAWELGLKTLYYMKTGAAVDGDMVTTSCESCEA
jgi:ribonucleoside-diphosphate reductase alpha chain